MASSLKDYYSLFVELSLKQCTINDYANKSKVKEHNKASKKLKLLQLEMAQNCSKEILHMLLSHDDDRVKINAATLCLQMDALPEQSMLVLKNIIDFSPDSTMRFAAKMLSQNHMGTVPLRNLNDTKTK